MTIENIKTFMEVTEGEEVTLFGDNAINFFNDHRNGHIFIDEANELIHYFANTGNTIPDTYYTEEGQYTKSCEYTLATPDMIQFARVKLSPEKTKEVMDKLIAKGFITEENKKEVLDDIVVMGRRSNHKTAKQEITKL